MSKELIYPLTGSDVAETTALLELAFAQDPSFMYFFAPETNKEARNARIRSFCLFMVERTIRAGDLALGFRDSNGRLVAFALAEDYRGLFGGTLRRTLADLSLYWTRLRPLGSGVLARMAAYFKVSRSLQAQDLSLYLVMIGVDPIARGRGLSRALIDHLRAYDRIRPWARGFGLDTESPANIDLYTHLGFTHTGTAVLDGLSIFAFHNKYKEPCVENL